MRTAMILELLIIVSGTLPQFQADSAHCRPGLKPAWDIAWVELYGAERWQRGPPILLGRERVHGKAGQRFDFFVSDSGPPITVWTRTVDIFSNRSCESNYVLLRAPSLAVPPGTHRMGPRSSWFDLQGRRMDARMPGVYVHPDSGKRRVLR